MYKLSLIYSIILFTCNKSTKGVMLSPCGEDQVFEVVENKSENVCFCELNLLSDVQWYWMAVGQEVPLGSCNHNTFTCTKQQKLPLLLKVESTYVSKVIINTTDLPDKGLVLFQNTSIKCKSDMQLEASCKMDYIVEVKDVMCHASYDSAIIPWRVVATCNIGIAYSFLNRYSCQLYQVDKGAVKIGQMAAMIISQIEKHYVSGFCQMLAPISNEGGHFSYNVIISPGRKIFSATFIGQNSTIRVPTSPPTHTCSEYIMEGATSVCTCTGDLGVPAGNILWDISGTSILTIPNVRRAQSGTVYSCYTSWNGRYVQSVSYTLQVAYPSIILQFGFNNRTCMTVNEMEVVVLTCYADGKPSPKMQIKKMSNGIVLASGPQGMLSIDDETIEARHTFNMTRCDDTGRYACEVDSMMGEEKHAVAELYVKCAPRLLYSSEMSEMTKHVIFTDSHSALSFVVAAFPLPSTPTVMFWKEISDNFSSKATDAVQLKCQPLSELYQTNCTITVNRELHVETGNYSVIFVNDLGRLEYRFELQLNGNNPDSLQSYPPIGAYVGGAFGAGIFILAISVGIIVLLKHRRKQRTSEDGANNITTHALQVDNASQTDVLTANEGAYSALQMADVGQRSPYADFHIYSN